MRLGVKEIVQLDTLAVAVGLRVQLDWRLSELDAGLELKVTVPVGVIGVPIAVSLTLTVHEIGVFVITEEVQVIVVEVDRSTIVMGLLVPELRRLFAFPG
jgi:hypothetical protein